jgi:hypothetical protein
MLRLRLRSHNAVTATTTNELTEEMNNPRQSYHSRSTTPCSTDPRIHPFLAITPAPRRYKIRVRIFLSRFNLLFAFGGFARAALFDSVLRAVLEGGDDFHE